MSSPELIIFVHCGDSLSEDSLQRSFTNDRIENRYKSTDSKNQFVEEFTSFKTTLQTVADRHTSIKMQIICLSMGLLSLFLLSNLSPTEAICQWTGCGKSCPNGASTLIRTKDGCGGLEEKSKCCFDYPVHCQVTGCGHETCPKGTKTLAQTNEGCSGFDTRSMCCINQPATCEWGGCGYNCPSGTITLVKSNKDCGGFDMKSYCCKSGPYNCQFGGCGSSCPSGTTVLAEATCSGFDTKKACCLPSNNRGFIVG